MSSNVIEVEADSVQKAIDKGLKRLGKNHEKSNTDIEILQDPDAELFDAATEPARIRMSASGIDLLDSLDEILRTLLEKIGLSDFEINVYIEDGFYCADIESSDDLRFVIGRYGETLNALQHLTEKMLDRVADDTIEVVVDAGNYRERRQEDLVKMAREVSSKALDEEQEIELKPMIGVERKIIHEAIQDIEGVKTHSIGEDTNRRVVILPKGQS
jgi:spoIIIJ-associated protein